MKAIIEGQLLKVESKTYGTGADSKQYIQASIYQYQDSEMINVRITDPLLTVEMKEGEQVRLACTLNLYEFNGKKGLSVKADSVLK